MANRFEQPKVDPSIKKNVARARQNTLAGKSGKGFVVAASVAATLMGWGFFAQQDAQTAVTAQLNDPTPVATSVQQASTSSTTASSGPQVSSVSQIINPPTATPTTTTTTASTSQNLTATATATATTAATSTATSTPKATATPVVVATTRSSR